MNPNPKASGANPRRPSLLPPIFAAASLRQATSADLEAIYDLEVAGFVAGIVEEVAVFSRRIESFPEGFLVLEAASPWAAGGHGGLLGYFCCEIWSSTGAMPANNWPTERFLLNHDIDSLLDRSGQVLYIASMTVAEVARGSGLGRQLFRQALARMRLDFPALTWAILIVNEHWHGARRIYGGEGFTETGRIAGFFRPVAGPMGDAIIMERCLIV